MLPNPTFDLLLKGSLGKSVIENNIVNLCFLRKPIAGLPTRYSPPSLRAFGRPASRIVEQFKYFRLCRSRMELSKTVFFVAPGRDKRLAGAQVERPGLKEAMSHLREADTLVVWKLDRLGRSVKGLVGLVNELEAQKVHFQSITDGVQPAARLSTVESLDLDLLQRAHGQARQRVGAGRLPNPGCCLILRSP